MIRSMTGFGRGSFANHEREYVIEIKAVNHKYTDVNIRMPYVLSFLEEKIKKHILEKVARGKIDVNIIFTNNSNLGKKVTLNQDMAKAYITELKKMAEENNIIDDISIMKISRLPDVLNVVQDDNTELFWNELVIALDEALDNFITTKEKEGAKLAEDMEIRLEKIFQNISSKIKGQNKRNATNRYSGRSKNCTRSSFICRQNINRRRGYKTKKSYSTI